MDFSKTHDIKRLEEKLEFIFNYFKKKNTIGSACWKFHEFLSYSHISRGSSYPILGGKCLKTISVVLDNSR